MAGVIQRHSLEKAQTELSHPLGEGWLFCLSLLPKSLATFLAGSRAIKNPAGGGVKRA